MYHISSNSVMATSSSTTTVWAKGDKCLLPYPGDTVLYRAVIDKIRRSPAGHVTAMVRYTGYGDDTEEVDLNQLEKIVQETTNKSAIHRTPVSSTVGFFKPLSSEETNNRLKEKYGSLDENQIQIEKLTTAIFDDKKSPRAGKSGRSSEAATPTSRSKKGVVAVGGKAISRSTPTHQVSDHSVVVKRTPRRSKGVVAVGGGALEGAQELRPTKKLSDISSILDEESVRIALGGDRDNVSPRRDGDNVSPRRDGDNVSPRRDGDILSPRNHNVPAAVDDHGTECKHRNTGDVGFDVDIEGFRDDKGRRKRREKVEVSEIREPEDVGESWHEDGIDGFDEGDLEKPKFSYKPEAAKVPYTLSDSGEEPVIQVPATLNQYLRDYQREGIRFLYGHYRYNRGAILGDDMGLGKTVQVIGFLSALLGKQGNRVDAMRQKPKFIRKLSDSATVRADTGVTLPFLIIGPGCVLYNWLEELETWGYFTARKFHGTDKDQCLADVRRGRVEVVVTTYETFREHQEVLNSIDWCAVIADEVHKIKGMKAQTTKALRTLRTRRRYGLTGTALQNNLMELWCIMDWAQTGCLGSQNDFHHEYVRHIELGQRHDANKRELAAARKCKEKFAAVRKGMMIRRMKTLIADQLPKKDDNVVYSQLSDLQTRIYKTILSHPDMALVLEADDPCDCDSGATRGKCCYKKSQSGKSVRSLMFTFMHLLLKTSNHVAMLLPTAQTSGQQARHARAICEVALRDHPEFVTQTREASFKTLSNPKYCGKMKILQGLLNVFSKSHSKVLVFSYSTQVLDIIEQYLMTTGFEYRRIDGSVSVKKRMVIVREFNTDPNIFVCLISTKAGGLGLNLTGANKVVIFDPNWNPTHDLQAQDRAYRIGQRRNVEVYRLVSAGTIEENMYLRQIYKQQLLNVTVEDENARRYFYAVQGSKRQKGELFGVKNMFQLQTGGSCRTMDILKRNERVECALAGYEVARYIPPVVRVEDDEDLDDVLGQSEPSSESPSEDIFADFFSSPDMADNEDQLVPDVLADDDDDSISSSDMETTNSTLDRKRKGNNSNPAKAKTNVESLDFSDDDTDNKHDKHTNSKIKPASKKAPASGKKSRVSFRPPEPVEERGGKVRPSQSKTGKGPLTKKVGRRPSEEEMPVYDQTLAGTFTDVADVFDNCGVIHVHENVKVVGGSRAEDHMSRCAISDVYERHQNSQDLAVQCEPLSESSEEEPEVVPVQRGRRRGEPTPDHNTPCSTVVGSTKVLIGQTPRGIKMKHMELLMKHHKCATLVDFAALVLGSSLEDRVQLLNDYYGSRDPALRDIHKVTRELESNEKETASLKKLGKQTSTRKARTPATKKPVKRQRKKTDKHAKRKLNQSLGILYSDMSDSESVHLGIPDSVNDQDQEYACMEVGLKSPGRRKVTKMSPRKVSPKIQKDKDLRQRSAHVPVTPSYVEIMDEGSDDRGEDFGNNAGMVSDGEEADEDRLLSQMCRPSDSQGNAYTDTVDGKCAVTRSRVDRIDNEKAHGKKQMTSAPDNRTTIPVNTADEQYKVRKKDNMIGSKDNNYDILDDIFHDNTNTAKRKPPPSKGKKFLHKADAGNTRNEKPSVQAANNYSNDGSQSENSEAFLDISTLKDDNYDCFQDPSKWKKRKRKVVERVSRVDRLISDGDNVYNNLFATGKLKKRTLCEKPEHAGSPVKTSERTPNLFSSP